MNQATMDLLKRLASAVADQFGTNCEVVVHDLTVDNPEHTIAAIENGHVSKRHEGDGPSQIVLESLHAAATQELSDQHSYLTRTHDGRILKSSTVYVREEDGKPPVGIFSINYDITNLLMAQNSLDSLLNLNAQEREKEPERIPQNVTELLDDLIERSVALVGKPVALMTKDDKVRAIQFLNQAGAFLITKSGDKVSRYFGISKYTLYSYLDTRVDEKS